MAYPVRVGDATVVALSDKHHAVETTFHFPTVPAEAWAPYADLLTDEGLIPLNFGAFLVLAAGRVALVDTGWGPLAGPPGRPAGPGRLLDELAEVGLTPEDVDVVAFTHLHPDHVGWNLVPDGGGGWRPRFRRARYLVPEADWAHYRSLEEVHPVIREQALGLDGLPGLELVPGDGAVMPSLTGVATPGHTPGHRSFVVESAGERLFILGDLTHSPVLAEETSWVNRFDWDPALARTTRERVLERLEHDATLVAAGHYPYPSLGRFVRVDGRRRWRPADVRSESRPEPTGRPAGGD
ncbi:MAG TPA: MBL fold metallo-hydrolase [Candidatus Limnocylindrales bacterium]|nr:MBL fold metallo-hydrolase [Candidatus Limnocylindrales bacterium]